MNAVNDFIATIENDTRRTDAIELLAIMEDVSGYKPYLSGSIVGFGKYDYKYDSGLEGTSSVTAFSPRKQNLVLYIMPGFDGNQALLDSLGKHKVGKSCLYLNKLADIDLAVLRKLIKLSVKTMQGRYQCRSS